MEQVLVLVNDVIQWLLTASQ